MPPLRDYSTVAPQTTIERVSLRAALSNTRNDFFSYIGSYPTTETDEWASYIDQYGAIQHEFTEFWKAMYPHKPMPVLFGFVGWRGGITNWPRTKRTEQIIDACARPNKARLVTAAERQRAAKGLSMMKQPKNVSNRGQSGGIAKPAGSSHQPMPTQNMSRPTSPPPQKFYVFSNNPKDARSKFPNIDNELEMISLDRALSYSRTAFYHYIGRPPRQTDKTACYATQYHEMYVEFLDAWNRKPGPESKPPKLFCLPQWEGGIMDWKVPVEDEEYMRPFVYALKRLPFCWTSLTRPLSDKSVVQKENGTVAVGKAVSFRGKAITEGEKASR